jgi:hypothetical protein
MHHTNTYTYTYTTHTHTYTHTHTHEHTYRDGSPVDNQRIMAAAAAANAAMAASLEGDSMEEGGVCGGREAGQGGLESMDTQGSGGVPQLQLPAHLARSPREGGACALG